LSTIGIGQASLGITETTTISMFQTVVMRICHPAAGQPPAKMYCSKMLGHHPWFSVPSSCIVHSVSLMSVFGSCTRPAFAQPQCTSPLLLTSTGWYQPLIEVGTYQYA